MSDQNDSDILADMVYYLRDIASFFRRADLAGVLTDSEQRRAYELSDGKRSAADIKREGQISKSDRSIQNWWTRWTESGIADRQNDGKVRAKYSTAVIPSLPDGVSR